MKRDVWVNKLSNILFWDVDRATVDPDTHLRWIIERVLERGDYGDWLILKDNVIKETMKEELNRLRIDPRSSNFLKRYLYGPDQTS